MVHDLDIRQFLRRAGRDWLRRYFQKVGVLDDFAWDELTSRNIEELYDAWMALDEQCKLQTGEDFNNLQMIGSAGGKTVIVDEAQFHPASHTVVAELSALPDPLSCAFWVYLERPELWNGTVFFSAADLKPKRHWRKRLNIPKLGRDPGRPDAAALAAAVSKVFLEREARGAHCEVHHYRRGTKEYYFTYPQDHRGKSNEYDEEGRWTERPYNPAFEIIFVHDDAEQSLSIWHSGSRERVKDLQVAFAKAVLGQEVPKNSPKDERVYDLEGFRNPNMTFHPRPELGIAEVEVRKMTVRTLGADQHTIRIELGQKTTKDLLLRRLEQAMRGLDPTTLKVASIGLRVIFDLGPDERQAKVRSFDLSWPNSCSLDDDSYGQRIRQMLSDHGIEPRLIAGDPSNDSAAP